ncbi:9244_t:CDS:2 [Diversispora eburnea]|uniref:Decapping nuclease n=1 Tax=Diversispora eburnea TaxID=1213867 RepID=A0A9N9F7L2_9GLOM|nr:9244_t:CDS:2 [Diversispora eburnea]
MLQSSFLIQPIKRFNVSSPTYKKPVEIGNFSYDEQRVLHMDDREMKYYHPPDLNNCDLSDGYETFIQRNGSGIEPIHSLIDAIEYSKSSDNNKNDNLYTADLVSWRGVFTKILCAPYNKNEPWELGATLWNHTIFLEEHETEQTRERNFGNSPRHKLMIYWGYKFENLSTINKPSSQITSPDDPELINRKYTVVNTNTQYCSVAKTTLGNTRIIMGAEVDCISDTKPIDLDKSVDNYIELKTTKLLGKSKDIYNFERYKLLKFWAQSFLIGIPKVIVGFRDDNGFVKQVKEYKTLEIPRIVRGKSGMWNVIVINDPKSSYTITFNNPFQEIKVKYADLGNSVLAERHYIK